MVITQAKAEQLLQNDLTSFEEAVNRLVSRNLTPNQFAALVSFAYNCGVGSLEESTLLRYVNAGKFQAAAGEFGRWVSGGSGPMPGLVRRRAAEAKLFLEK
jgi:lysozyme